MDKETQYKIVMLEQQRNDALNKCVLLATELALLKDKLQELEAQTKE